MFALCYAELIQRLRDDSKEIAEINFLNDDLALVSYRVLHHQDLEPALAPGRHGRRVGLCDDTCAGTEQVASQLYGSELNTTNVVLAAYTTAHARLKLYEAMEKISAFGHNRLLYTDTDSLFYVSKGNDGADPPLGRCLGDLTSEEPNDRIVSFTCCGPKVYAYALESGREVVKVRGFTLNYANSRLINRAALCTMVKHAIGARMETAGDGGDEDGERQPTMVIVNPSKITRTRQLNIINREEKKKFRMVYSKRVIGLPGQKVSSDDPDMLYVTYPYGYRVD